MFYAEFSPYGTNTLSQGMELARFETRRERDEWVSRMNSFGDIDRWQAVTTREVSHRFDIRKFDHDPFNDYCHEYNGLRTCDNRPVNYIEMRPSYRF